MGAGAWGANTHADGGFVIGGSVRNLVCGAIVTPMEGGQRNARDHRAGEDFQDRSVQRSLLSRRLQHHRRKAGRVRPLDRAAPSGPSPSKQLLRGDPVTPRDLGHHRPTASVSSRIRAFSSDDHRRRRPVPVNTSTRRATLGLGSSLWSNIFTCRSQIRDRNLPPHT